MATYYAHMAVILPFWLRLEDGEYDLRLDGRVHRVRIANDVVQVDEWESRSAPAPFRTTYMPEAEHRKAGFADDGPISIQPHKTVVTHIVPYRAADDEEAIATANQQLKSLPAETLRVTNRMLEVYMVELRDDLAVASVGPLSEWDVRFMIGSIWRESRQVSGLAHPVVSEERRPESLQQSRTAVLRRAFKSKHPPSIIALRLQTARNQLARGGYRAAVVDAVTALELRAEQLFRRVAKKRGTPAPVIRQMLRFGRWDEMFRDWIPDLRGPKVPQINPALWERGREARRARQFILHEGGSVSAQDARLHVDTCIELVHLFDTLG